MNIERKGHSGCVVFTLPIVMVESLQLLKLFNLSEVIEAPSSFPFLHFHICGRNNYPSFLPNIYHSANQTS